MPNSLNYGRKGHARPQILAQLIVRQFFETEYRAIIQIVAEVADLQRTVGHRNRPQYSTLCYAVTPILKKGLATACSRRFLSGAGERRRGVDAKLEAANHET